MADFIGETVLVTLKQPENAQVRGLVTDIVNQQLKLKDGKFGTYADGVHFLSMLPSALTMSQLSGVNPINERTF